MRITTAVCIVVAFCVAAVLKPVNGYAEQDAPLIVKAEPLRLQDVDARFRLYETKSIWIFLLLDSATGRVWQVQYSLDETPRGTWTLVENSLLPKGATESAGRFALVATKNFYNFLLLDQENGRIWQIQWSTDNETRGIISTMPPQDSGN